MSSPPPRERTASGHDLPPGEDWRDYRRAILDDLAEVKRENRELRQLIVDQSKSLAVLTTKVSLYAAAFGAGTSAIVAVCVELIARSVGK